MKKWIVLFAVGIFLFLANLDMTIVNLALADFSREFAADMRQVELVIVAYLAAAAAFFCLSGKLADFFGKKKIFLIGSLLFVASSFYIGAASNSINAVIIGRFVQGIGFSATLGLAILLIVNAFPAEKRGLATGAAVTITGVGLAFGPPLGGLILHYFGWRWIFLINVPIGLVSIALTMIYVDKDEQSLGRSLQLDKLSIPLYLIGLGSLIYLSNKIGKLGFNETVFLVLIGFMAIAAFVKRSLKADYPLIHVALLKNRRFLVIILIRMLFMFVMASFLFTLPLYMRNILDFSEMQAGMWLLSMTGIIALFAPIIGKIIDRFGYQLPIFASMVFLLLSSVAFLFLDSLINIPLFLVGLFCFGLSNGAHTTSTVNGATSQVSSKDSGTAIGVFFTVAILGSMLGVTLSGVFLDTTSHMKMLEFIGQSDMKISAEHTEWLVSFSNGNRNLQQIAKTFPAELAPLAKDWIVASYLHSLHLLMGLNGLISIMGILLSLTLFKPSTNQREAYDDEIGAIEI